MPGYLSYIAPPFELLLDQDGEIKMFKLVLRFDSFAVGIAEESESFCEPFH